MARYVILQHDFPKRGRAVHWDLMLECGEALRTWALAAPPAPGVVIAAEALADHRLAYLDYEGPVSGNRGSLSRWDSGRFIILSESESRLVVSMIGERVDGAAILSRRSDKGQDWEFTLERLPP